MPQHDIAAEIESYRQHFDAMYVGGIPNLLNDSGAFLSFVTVLAGTEALAGLYRPALGAGERFRQFVAKFFPAEYTPHASELWSLRNGVVHSFNPGPFALTHHNSRLHLESPHGQVLLNAEDFYASLVFAYKAYFAALAVDEELQSHFIQRVSAKDGGAPQVWLVQQGQPAPAK
jgi:hypothetical protein